MKKKYWMAGIGILLGIILIALVWIPTEKITVHEMEVVSYSSDTGGGELEAQTIGSPENVVRTNSKEVVTYDSGKKSVTIFSGVRFVKEDNIMKPIEEARSLMDAYNKGLYKLEVISNDPDYVIELTDFNYTTIKFTTSVASKHVGKDIPLNVAEKLIPNVLSQVDSTTIKFDDTKPKDISLSVNPLSKRFKFGLASTEIELRDNGSEVMNDDYTRVTGGATEMQGDTEYLGYATVMDDYDLANGYVAAIEFNQTIAEDNMVIDNASLIVTHNLIQVEHNFSLLGWANDTWSQSNCSGCQIVNGSGWINRRDLPPESNLTYINESWTHIPNGAVGVYYHPVTTWVATRYAENKTYSFFFNTTNNGSASNTRAYSKEHSNISARTALNITYHERGKTVISDINLEPDLSLWILLPSINASFVATNDNQTATKINISYRWYINNAENLTGDMNNSYDNGSTIYSTVNLTNMLEGDVVIYSIRGYDGNDYGDWYNSSSITMDKSIFSLCNATNNLSYLNISFRDEKTLSALTSNITSSLFNYTIGASNKDYSYNSSVAYGSYSFCARPNYSSISLNIDYFRYSTDSYPQRSYSEELTLTNTTTNQTLYLLGSGDGQYVTFIVNNIGDQALKDVLAEVRDSGTLIESAETNDAGAATFWLNADQTYNFRFSKLGYLNYTTTMMPTQTSYIVTLVTADVTNQTDVHRGISYTILPSNISLSYNQSYNFSFAVTSTYYILQSAGYSLYTNNSLLIGSASCAKDTGCTASGIFNVTGNTSVTMNYYWLVNSTYVNGTHYWDVFYKYTGNQSLLYIIKHDFQSLGSGFNNFTKSIISVIIIVVIIGGLSMVSGTLSPIAIIWELFALVFLLESVEFVPSLEPITGAVPYFYTIAIGVLAAAYTIYDYGSGK